jgi:hypothetical protein
MYGWRFNTMTCVVIVACGMFPTTWVRAATTTQIEAEGVAAIRQGNVGVARDQSLEDALRKAVEQAVGTFIESESRVQNFRLLSDEIYSRTKGYVQRYTVVREQHEGGLFRVTVQATVDMGSLESKLDALGLLYRRMKKPRIMVIISEASPGNRFGNPAGETEIIRQLLQNGIKVVDQEQTQQIRQSDQVRKMLEGDTEAAKRIGLQYGAEMLIVGQAAGEVAMRGKEFGGLISARARLQARAIRADTGAILVADGQAAPGVDIEGQAATKKALAEAGRLWAEKNLPEIWRQWEREITDSSSVQLVVNGMNLRQLVQFEELLRTQVRGVKDVQRRSLDKDIAVLDLDLRGTGQSLANELAQQKVNGFEIEVVRFSSHRLELRARQKK